MKHTIIFDVDGTLIDSYDKFAECIRLTLSKNLNRQISKLLVQEKMASRFQDLFSNFGIQGEGDLQEYINLFSRFWHDSRIPIRLYPGIDEFLKVCASYDFQMIVWSARDHLTVEDSLHSLQIRHYFENVFCYRRESGGKPAPDPELLRMSTKLFGKSALIGDSDTDRDASLAIQAKFFRASWKNSSSATAGYSRPQDCLSDVLSYFERIKRCI